MVREKRIFEVMEKVRKFIFSQKKIDILRKRQRKLKLKHRGLIPLTLMKKVNLFGM